MEKKTAVNIYLIKNIKGEEKRDRQRWIDGGRERQTRKRQEERQRQGQGRRQEDRVVGEEGGGSVLLHRSSRFKNQNNSKDSQRLTLTLSMLSTQAERQQKGHDQSRCRHGYSFLFQKDRKERKKTRQTQPIRGPQTKERKKQKKIQEQEEDIGT